MESARNLSATDKGWTPIVDPPERYSSGIPDLDRLLGGGFGRGGLALFNIDETVTPEDRDLMLFPTILNFLYQSRGMIAVLPARDLSREFRARLTRFTTRRRFDSRVRIVDYVGENDEAPYVVTLHSTPDGKTNAEERRARDRELHMNRMVEAERAAQGDRKRAFIEMIAFEVAEMAFGPEVAVRMYFHGLKRSRLVGNLVLGILRPGLRCADAVRGMADTEFHLHRDDIGLTLRGTRPAFPNHLVTVDPKSGAPHVAFVPAP